MKRAFVLFALLAMGCPQDRSQPTFDSFNGGVFGGGVNPSGAGGSGLTSVTVSGGTITSSGTAGPSIPNCECIYEIMSPLGPQACRACAVTQQMGTGLCATDYQACQADQGCNTNLTLVCPKVTDDPLAIAQCLDAGTVGRPLLQAYFDCICSQPGQCDLDCKGNQNCGVGGGGGATTTSTTSTGP